MKTIGLFVCTFCLTVGSIAQESPPPSALERIAYPDYVALETTVRTGPYQGMSWWECIEPPNPEINGQVLLALLYDAQEIPGYALMPSSFNGIHTGVRVGPPGKPCEAGRTFSSLAQGALKEGRSAPLGTVTVQVEILPSVEQAQKRLEEYRRIMLHALAVDREVQEQVITQLPSERSFGLPMYMDRRWEHHRALFLVAGRAVLQVQVSQAGTVSEDFAEALAWGLLYRIQRFSRFFAQQGALTDNIHLLNGVRVEPLRTLEGVGCKIFTYRPEERWTKYLPAPESKSYSGKAYTRWTTRVFWGQRWVELEAFGWQMKTWDGRQVRLSRPAFPYGGDLVAPLQEVKQTLGIP